MRKMLLTPLIVCMVALLSTLSTAAYAMEPQDVEGTFDYIWWPTEEPKLVDSNLFIYAGEHEEWNGDFVGQADAIFTVVIHKAEFDEEGNIIDSSFWNVWLRSTFTGTVNGKSGTMVIQLVGKKPGPLPDQWWTGQWLIISGTGDLANLRGQGTWEGPGFGAEGPDINYEGQIHFD